MGVGYAISINQIKNFMGYLRAGRVADHATLGAQVATDDEGRVVVSNILNQSDAFRRGLRYDDEIVRFGNRPVTTANGFKNVLGIYPKDWRVPLSFRRETKRHDVLVRLAGVHGEAELLKKLQPRRRMPVPVPRPGQPQPDRPQPEQPGEPEQPRPGDDPQQPRDEPDQPDEHPQPGDDPEKPDEQQPRQHRIQVPRPGHDGQPPRVVRREQPMPEICKKHFEEKHGYANFFFNKLNRDRVWKAWAARGDFAPLGGDWTISGPVEGGGSFSCLLTAAGAKLKLPAGEVEWKAGENLASSLLPAGSGGLLPALHLWRRLAIDGPDRFGQVTYLGTAPLVGHEGLVDVLSGVDGGIECRFYFDPQAGRPAGAGDVRRGRNRSLRGLLQQASPGGRACVPRPHGGPSR